MQSSPTSSKQSVMDLPVITKSQLETLSTVQMGNRYYVPDKKMGDGSDSTVYTCPVFFELNAEGKYDRHESQAVIKTCALGDNIKRDIAWAHRTDMETISEKSDRERFVKTKFDEKLQHEYAMLQLYGDPEAAISFSGKDVILRMSTATGVPLDKFLIDNKDTLTFKDRKAIAELVASAVDQLHAKGLSHLDLKPENIYYDPNKKEITFIDFGSAQPLNTKLAQIPTYLHISTPGYSPDHETNTPKQVDNYSLARIINEVLGGYQYNFQSIPTANLTDEQQKERNLMVSALIRMAQKEPENRSVSYSAAYGSAKVAKELDTWFWDNNKDLLKSQKSCTKKLCKTINDKFFLVGADENALIKLLRDVIDEAVKTQSKPRLTLGFVKIDKLGGSDVLKAILKLPEPIKAKIGSEFMQQAEKYSQAIHKRRDSKEAIDLPSVDVSPTKR